MIRDEQITTMREIKFRGRSVHTDDWCYGSFVNNPDEPTICGFDIWADGDSDWREEKVEPHTVGQFTGLRDKNGKEIYEGDFVRYHMHERGIHESEYQTGIVEFGGGCFYADIECSTLYFCGDSEDYEVIGNKWDNPELLKGDEK